MTWIICNYTVGNYDYSYPGYPINFSSDAGENRDCWSEGASIASVPIGTQMTEEEVMKAISGQVVDIVLYKPSGKRYDAYGQVLTCAELSAQYFSLISEYDTNNDGMIDIDEMMKAIGDYNKGLLTLKEEKVIESFWKQACVLSGVTPPKRYECDKTTSQCVEDPNGRYISKTDCESTCKPPLLSCAELNAQYFSLISEYDANKDGMIDDNEMVKVYNDYIFERLITKEEVIAIESFWKQACVLRGYIPPKRYECDRTTFQCVENPNGRYMSKTDCENACKPPTDQYYDCINGQCTLVPYVTTYKNDPMCKNTCKPSPDQYYDCINGQCTLVSYITTYKNDPTCGNKCKPSQETSWLLPLGLLGLGIIGYVYLKKKQKK